MKRSSQTKILNWFIETNGFSSNFNQTCFPIFGDQLNQASGLGPRTGVAGPLEQQLGHEVQTGPGGEVGVRHELPVHWSVLKVLDPYSGCF